VSGEPIVLGVGAITTARRVGPTAWTVLTALALRAEPVAGQLSARASVRSLAEELGLNKDTVCHAVARLRQAGLLARSVSPFEFGSYCMSVPSDVIRIATAPTVELVPRRRPPTVASSRQLRLLEAD
jgi:hypothetical protein